MNKVAFVALASLAVGAYATPTQTVGTAGGAVAEPPLAVRWEPSSAARWARWLLLLALYSAAPITIAASGAIGTATSIADGADARENAAEFGGRGARSSTA